MKTPKENKHHCKCPLCKKDFSEFLVEEHKIVLSIYDGTFYDETDADDVEERIYACPNCCKDLFDEEEDADAFLAGENRPLLKKGG